MRKPRSYTGEDIVEVYCHGGAFVVRRVLQLVHLLEARAMLSPASLPSARF